ncbi:MAG: efflux RND transporter periplasmic adaptor subunit [Desulfuromusa sp.]|nr:efflux RND transporter periplasmic adaptor subunit [Desulfuromusa sp.]
MSHEKPIYVRILGGLTLSFILLITLNIVGCKKEEVKAPPVPVEVNAIKIEPRTIPVETSFVAQAESSHRVEIVARVNGFLDKILYTEGSVVKQGQKMFLMDQKPYKAQVEAAQAALEKNKAQLWIAQSNLDRIKPLVELDAASKSDLDNAIGAVKSAEAAVHQARAHLDQAELDLSYTVIRSPVDGVSGESLAREGAYLTAGLGGNLSYVAHVDPIWVDFSVSQNQLAKVRVQAAAGEVIPPPNKEYTVSLELSEGDTYSHTGKVSFVDPSFNQDTGTFLVRAELPNPEGRLQPGMFVKAILSGMKRPNALLVPQRAVQKTSDSHVVFVVNSKGAAEPRSVTVGAWVGNDWVIEKGLNPGEMIITDGFQRLAAGMPVKVVTAALNTDKNQSTETAVPADTK